MVKKIDYDLRMEENKAIMETMAEFHRAAYEISSDLRLCAAQDCLRWSLQEYCIIHREHDDNIDGMNW